MTISINSVSALTQITATSIQATAPASINAGDAIFNFCIAFGTSATASISGGYTNDSPVAQPQILAARAVGVGGGADVMPTFTWSSSIYTAAFAVSVSGMDTTFTPQFTFASKGTTSTNNISSPSVSRTPGVNNSIVFILAKRDKTATSDSLVYPNPSGWSSLIALGGGANVN